MALFPHVPDVTVDTLLDRLVPRVPAAVNAVGDLGRTRKRTRVAVAAGASSQEIGTLVLDEQRGVVAAGGAAAGAPAWAAPLFALVPQVTQMQVQLQWNEARFQNSFANLPADVLGALCVRVGPVNAFPPLFPATVEELDRLGGPAITGLLVAYGRPVPRAVAAQRQALKRFIGMRPVVRAVGI